MQDKKVDKGKFDTNYMSPYIIKTKYSNRAYKLVIVKGKLDKFATNAKHQKPFYVWEKHVAYIL